jgi:hypothetical protein
MAWVAIIAGSVIRTTTAAAAGCYYHPVSKGYAPYTYIRSSSAVAGKCLCSTSGMNSGRATAIKAILASNKNIENLARGYGQCSARCTSRRTVTR